MTGEAYLFWIRGLIKDLPENEREEFKSELIERLNNYEFMGRKKIDPPHPERIGVIEEPLFDQRDPTNPDDVFETILVLMHPYYVANTQNRIRRYIIKNL